MDLGTQLLLNLVQVETVVPIDQVDSKTQVTKSARTTNSVKIGLGVLWEVEVDYHIHSLNIDTTSEKV